MTEEEIIAICEEYKISNYTINPDGSIDVDGNVTLSSKKLTKLPLRFGNVRGSFFCDNNQLTSLEGGPSNVGGSFYCMYNQLTSLIGGPSSVGDVFYCRDNRLSSLEGGPKSVGMGFYCSNNRLRSLRGCPSYIGDAFYCNGNRRLTAYETRILLLSIVKGEVKADKGAGILMSGRIDGVMPSELIPGKIKQLKDMT